MNMVTNSIVIYKVPTQPSRVFIAHHWRKVPSLSIVIPVFNAEGNIAPLFAEISKYLDGKYNYEVLFVDDHSTDNTAMVLGELAAKFSVTRYIRLDRQCGQSGALVQGVKAARSQLIVTLDGDGRNDPADIDRLVRYYNETANDSPRYLINGCRLHKETKRRWFPSIIANLLKHFMVLHDSAPDGDCSIKVFSRDFFFEFPAFNRMHRFLPELAIQLGGTVVSIDVNHRHRINASSHYRSIERLSGRIIDFLGVVWLGRRAIKAEIQPS